MLVKMVLLIFGVFVGGVAYNRCKNLTFMRFMIFVAYLTLSTLMLIICWINESDLWEILISQFTFNFGFVLSFSCLTFAKP